jgi:hypothetical protein
MSILDQMNEKVVIQEFLRNRDLFEGANITYPDPPDCVFDKNGAKGWIEVTSFYRHWKHRIINEKKPFGTMEYEVCGSDSDYIIELQQSFRAAIEKKDKNPSYKICNEKYGKGYLIIFVDVPYWNRINKQGILNQQNYNDISLNVFNAVYFYEFPNAVTNSMGSFSLLIPSRTKV